MLPVYTGVDFVDHLFIHAILTGKSHVSLTKFNRLDFFHLSFGELCSTMSTTTSRPAPFYPVPYVVRVCAGEKVGRIYSERVVAGMAHNKTIYQLTVDSLINMMVY